VGFIILEVSKFNWGKCAMCHVALLLSSNYDSFLDYDQSF